MKGTRQSEKKQTIKHHPGEGLPRGRRMHPQRIAVLLIFLLMGTLFSGGCSFIPEQAEEETEDNSDGKDTVFTFAGTPVSLGEVFIYADTVKESYEKQYGSGIWDLDTSAAQDGSRNLAEDTREDLVTDIIRVKMLCSHAEEEKISLSQSDENEIASETDAFYQNLTDEQIRTMHLSRNLLQKVIRENRLAKKVQESLLNQAGIEVSDEEARETTFYDLCFPGYATATDGDMQELSGQDLNLQREKALQAYDTLVNPIGEQENSTNIEGLASYYGLEQYSGYHTMTPAEIQDIYGRDICDSLYQLEDGSYSLVMKSEYGYHVFYMKALTDREATDQEKEIIRGNREKVYLDQIFEDWQKEADPDFSYDSVDQTLYQEIRF